MADTHDSVPDPEPSVDLTKRDDGASPSTNSTAAGSVDEAIALPRMMQFAIVAIGAQVVLGVVYATLSWPFARQLHDAIAKSAKNAKPPKVLCGTPHVRGCVDVDKTLHAFQRSSLIAAIVVGLLIIFLASRIRRGSRGARIVYIVAPLFAALFAGYSATPLSLSAVFTTGPAVPRAVAVLGSIAAIAAIFGLFRRESQAYFNAKSPIPLGPRPGLGSLLRPGPRPSAQGSTERVPGMRTTPNRGENRPAARSKSRNDAEAIARGAALARSRAKANKSRRTDA